MFASHGFLPVHGKHTSFQMQFTGRRPTPCAERNLAAALQLVKKCSLGSNADARVGIVKR